MHFLFLALMSLFAAVPRQAQGPVQTDHRRIPYVGAIAIDAKSGRVLLEDNAEKECYPASCTKLMTMRLTLRAVSEGKLELDQRIFASKVSVQEKPSILGLKEGESITVRDALKAIMVKSANDVAVMLAEAVGGTKERFVEMMNQEAKALGMTKTRFVTPNGYPPMKTRRGYDVSSARDLSKLALAIVREQPEALEYTSIKTCTIDGVKNAEGSLLILENHNNLLLPRKREVWMREVDGLKTGYHDAGGSSIVLTGQRDGKRAIVVVVGSSSASERDRSASRMLRDALGTLAW